MPAPPRRFALLALGACLALVAAVTLVNALADPYGSLGTGLLPVDIDRDRAAKARRVASLAQAPDLVILGSSRARLVDERRTASRTGRSVFNAAVTDGMGQDAYAFTRLLLERFPDARPDFLWILDLESFRARPFNPLLLDDPLLARQFPLPVRIRVRLASLGRLVSWDPLPDSWRVIRRGFPAAPALAAEPSPAPDAPPKRRDRMRESIASYRRIHLREFAGIDGEARAWFERTVGALNGRGVEPVVVLSPYHPRALRALRDTGLEERRRELAGWLGTLPPRLRFAFHDMADISSFGGTAEDFTDGVHMKRRNLDRLVDEAVRRSGGALH